MKLLLRATLLLQFAMAMIGAVSAPAHATGFITVGSSYAGDGGTVQLATGSIMEVSLEADRSYACTAMAATNGSTLDLSDQVQNPDTTTFTAVKRGNVSPRVTADATLDDNRLALIPTQTGDHRFTVAQATGTEVARVECLETSLFGGYNTNVNDFNFLEITNTTGAVINGTVTARNFDGTVVIDKLPFSVGAENRIDVDVHTAAGADKFGFIKVNHDGPFGALQASVSQYRGTVADFELSESAPLRPREQSL